MRTLGEQLEQLLCDEVGVEKTQVSKIKKAQRTWNGEDKVLSEGTSWWNFRIWQSDLQKILTIIRGKKYLQNLKRINTKIVSKHYYMPGIHDSCRNGESSSIY